MPPRPRAPRARASPRPHIGPRPAAGVPEPRRRRPGAYARRRRAGPYARRAAGCARSPPAPRPPRGGSAGRRASRGRQEKSPARGLVPLSVELLVGHELVLADAGVGVVARPPVVVAGQHYVVAYRVEAEAHV